MTALEGIREYQEKATEGPWNVSFDDFGDEHAWWVPVEIEAAERKIVAREGGLAYDQNWPTIEQCKRDGQFIANARTDLPLLVAFVAAYDAWRQSSGIPGVTAYFGMVEAREALEREWSGANKQEQP